MCCMSDKSDSLVGFLELVCRFRPTKQRQERKEMGQSTRNILCVLMLRLWLVQTDFQSNSHVVIVYVNDHLQFVNTDSAAERARSAIRSNDVRLHNE